MCELTGQREGDAGRPLVCASIRGSPLLLFACTARAHARLQPEKNLPHPSFGSSGVVKHACACACVRARVRAWVRACALTWAVSFPSFVRRAAQQAADCVKSIGVSLSVCSIPGKPVNQRLSGAGSYELGPSNPEKGGTRAQSMRRRRAKYE